MVFQRNLFTTSLILAICQIIKGVHAKNLEVPVLLIDFPKVFDSIHRAKMESLLLVYGLPTETVTAIKKKMKVMVQSPDGDTDFFNIARRYITTIFVNNLPRLHTLNIKRSNERKWLYIRKKASSRQYSVKTITDADDLALLANALSQAKSLQHSLEQTVGGIGLHMNANKTIHVF